METEQNLEQESSKSRSSLKKQIADIIAPYLAKINCLEKENRRLKTMISKMEKKSEGKKKEMEC